MYDHIELGVCPDSERHAPIGSELQKQQAKAWMSQIIREFGPPPPDCHLKIKTLSAGGELVCEVYYFYLDGDDEGYEYGVNILDNAPIYWDDEALAQLEEFGEQQARQFVESVAHEAFVSWDDIKQVLSEEAMPVGTDLGTALQQQPLADKAQDAATQAQIQAKLDKQEDEREAQEQKKIQQKIDPLKTKMRIEFDKLQDDNEKVSDALKSTTDVGHGLTNLNRDIQNIFGQLKI